MENKDKVDTLKKRYFFKLSSNLIGSAISTIIQLIVPRSLGPAAYGNFGYMTTFFSNITNSLDMGSSTWFYTKLSRNKDDKKIIIFYRLVMLSLVLIVLLFVVFLASTPIHQKIWLDQSIQTIYLAMIFAIMTWILDVMSKVVDAYGLTVNAEKAKIAQRVAGLLVIFILFIIKRLNLFTFFTYQYFIIGLLLIFYILIIRKRGFSTPLTSRLEKGDGKLYLKDLFRYINPLVVYTIVGLLIGIFDRWLLQKFGGSIQQGFYTLSYQIGAIIILFTTSLTPLLMREFSIAFGKKDIESMSNMFKRFIPLMYGITAFLSCFVAVYSYEITNIIGGGKYKGAEIVVSIMAFFPMHQTYGHLTSTIYYATGQTKLYRNVGIIGLFLGLPLVYYFLAPQNMFGLNGGAIGLAVKMVLINIITVNMWLFFNTRLLKLSFLKFLLHQFWSAGIMVLIALGIKFGIYKIPVLKNNVIISLTLSGIFYTILILIIVFFVPGILGLDKTTIMKIRNRLISWFINIIKKTRK